MCIRDRLLPCLDLLGQRAVRIKLFLRLLQFGKAPGRGRHPAGNEAVLIAEGPVRFPEDHKMLVAGPIFRGLPVREVLGGEGVFFVLGMMVFFFFQAEDGIRDFCLSRGLGDVYKRQVCREENPDLR